MSDDIVREFRPAYVILFGSYAYGTPTADSDVDLLVVLEFKGKPIHKAVEILNRVNSKIPLDLIVRTPEQVRSRIANKDSFMCEVLEKGRRLYESDSG
ncbi:MAG TPA: nucleotidyltransferase domain-containing protein [Pyrinomonadaceae bacterium]|nr:nucleotidyltransferase domain-containing protein [Pyrinomonadaceae bacterium]